MLPGSRLQWRPKASTAASLHLPRRLSRSRFLPAQVAGAVALLLCACFGPREQGGVRLRYAIGDTTWSWAGGEPLLLLDQPDAIIAPDGQWHVVGTWYTLDLYAPTSTVTTIANGSAGREIIPETVAWAPGSDMLAFLQFDREDYSVHIINLGNLTDATPGLTVQRAGSKLAWLDRNTLVYDDFEQLYRVNTSSGLVAPLGPGHNPTPSPDGAHVAFELTGEMASDGCASAVSVGMINADGSGYRLLLSKPERFVSIVGWSENGADLIVRSRPIVCNALEPVLADYLYRIHALTGEIETLLQRAPDSPWPLHGLVPDPWSDRVVFILPECAISEFGEMGAAAYTQPIMWQLIVSSIERPDEQQVIATTESGQGCGFDRVEWVRSGSEQ